MRGKLEIDLHDASLTPPIRSIIEIWAEVDWFTPSGSTDEDGSRLFREHHESARHRAADHLAANLEVRTAIGGWAEFVTWCRRVQRPSVWDWKYSVLKPMSNAHSKAMGWTPNALPQESPLVLRFGDAGNEQVIWRGLYPDVGALPATTVGECARFYLGYAHSDLVACIEWQLAENHDDLSSNPYVSLIRCYRAGFYPFCLDAATVVMFRFATDEDALPRARLVSR